MNERVIAVGPILPDKLGAAIKDAIDGGPSTLLAQYVETVINVRVTGIILYGSATRVSASSEIGHSDVDLLVLVAESATGGVYGCSNELDIDLHVQSREAAVADDTSSWIFSDGRVLYDSHPPELEQWLEGLRTWRDANPDPWTAVDHLRTRVWAQRLISKIKRVGLTDPAVACLHEARLLAALPSLYAQHKCIRTTSIGSWWAFLNEKDEVFALSVSTYLSQRSFPPKAESLLDLIRVLYSKGENSTQYSSRGR